jgi:hypothetical protein
MVSEEKVLREQLARREKEIEELKKEKEALLRAALNQSNVNKDIKEEMEKLIEINKKLTERVKKYEG